MFQERFVQRTSHPDLRKKRENPGYRSAEQQISHWTSCEIRMLEGLPDAFLQPNSTGMHLAGGEVMCAVPHEQEGNAVNSHTQALVHSLVASQLRIDDVTIDDANRLEELGLDPLNLVLVVLRLEDLDGRGGSFPLIQLDLVETIGDLVALVDLWLHRDTTAYRTGSMGPRRSAGSSRTFHKT